MATLKTRRLLFIWLLGLSECLAAAGPPAPPAPPSRPVCIIPCDQVCMEDIQCTWETRQDPQTFTEYILHWKPSHNENPHVTHRTSSNGIIHRHHFPNSDYLQVWVEAKNRHGSVISEMAWFHTDEIFKPPPTQVTSNLQENIEISWNSPCDSLQRSFGSCDLQYRNEVDKDWIQVTDLHASYSLESSQRCLTYEFQVRCSCHRILKSNWSAVHRQQSEDSSICIDCIVPTHSSRFHPTPLNGNVTVFKGGWTRYPAIVSILTPIGKLDVWRDCGIISESHDCVLTWKELPPNEACGPILRYEIRLRYGSGTVQLVNVSSADPRSLLVCEELQCHLNSSLKDVSSVNVSAFNPHGASVPSYLHVPKTGEEKNGKLIRLNMTEEILMVSWTTPPLLSVSLKEYVVEYKQVGSLLSQGFDWLKVKKNQTTATFKGQFKKYTPYQVSLFTISNTNQVRYVSSAVGYSVEGLPSKVLVFKVESNTDTHVTLKWDPLPLLMRNGTILEYRVGVDNQNEYIVSSSETSVQLLHTSGPMHSVWIRAVTSAGRGETYTITINPPHSAYLKPILIGVLVVAILVALTLLCVCKVPKKVLALCFYEKVPDPRNSHIFTQVKNQLNDPLGWICIPALEPHPNISLLEVVEIPPEAFKRSRKITSDPEGLTRPVVNGSCSKMDSIDDQREDAECHRTNHRFGKEAYSKIVDSDEEKVGEEDEEEDSQSSSMEEDFSTGYEKHFMPTALEILEVS